MGFSFRRSLGLFKEFGDFLGVVRLGLQTYLEVCSWCVT